MVNGVKAKCCGAEEGWKKSWKKKRDGRRVGRWRKDGWRVKKIRRYGRREGWMCFRGEEGLAKPYVVGDVVL